MKTIPFLSCLLVALSLMAHFSPLAAQYDPPPPPEQSNTGGETPDQQDMGQVPPPDQGQPGPDDSVPPPDANPGDQGDPGGDVNFQTFYNDLSSQGNWVQTDDYGYVFQPNEEDPDWAPYTDGHWVYTDEGWTWVADDSEPFGWATYHYGRWANLDGYGWVWVPGYTWAPAWVSWRYGDGYCGWAPLPPATFVGVDFGGGGFGFHIGGDCDTAFGIGPGYYNFIPVGYLGARDYRHHFANRNNNFVIINNTRNVTNIVVNNNRGAGRFGRVSVGGPSIATINAQSSTPVQRVQLARSNRVGDAALSGNRLSVFAPQVNSASGRNFRPSHVARTFANARINNGTNINEPLMVNARVRGAAPSNEQIAAARDVHFSSGSRVATPETRPTAALTKPLSSFAPRTEGRQRTAGQAQQNAAASANAANTSRQDAAFTGNNRRQENNSQVHQGVVTPQAQAQVQAEQTRPAERDAQRQARVDQQNQADQQAQRQQEQQARQEQTRQANEQAQREQERVQRQQQEQARQEQTQRANEQAQREQERAQRPQQEQRPQVQQEHQQVQQHAQHQESHPQAQPQRQSAPPQHQGGNGGNHPANDGGGNKDDHH